MRVVVDSRLEIDPAARILQPPGQVLVCCAQAHAASDKARALSRFVVTDPERAAVRALQTGSLPTGQPQAEGPQTGPRLEIAGPWDGVEVLGLPCDERGKTDLAALLDELAARGVNELHVEAGHQLNGSLLKAGLVDELLVYLAPRMLGPGRGMAAFGPLAQLADSLALEFIECTPIGPDLRIRARPPGRAGFMGDHS
jgi:diaminohydroxyphosphoribosylaminopyrimidine deaminase/5-amino-6-(5-phosphoribosylamino)uracil reductase